MIERRISHSTEMWVAIISFIFLITSAAFILYILANMGIAGFAEVLPPISWGTLLVENFAFLYFIVFTDYPDVARRFVYVRRQGQAWFFWQIALLLVLLVSYGWVTPLAIGSFWGGAILILAYSGVWAYRAIVDSEVTGKAQPAP